MHSIHLIHSFAIHLLPRFHFLHCLLFIVVVFRYTPDRHVILTHGIYIYLPNSFIDYHFCLTSSFCSFSFHSTSFLLHIRPLLSHFPHTFILFTFIILHFATLFSSFLSSSIFHTAFLSSYFGVHYMRFAFRHFVIHFKFISLHFALSSSHFAFIPVPASPRCIPPVHLIHLRHF